MRVYNLEAGRSSPANDDIWENKFTLVQAIDPFIKMHALNRLKRFNN